MMPENSNGGNSTNENERHLITDKGFIRRRSRNDKRLRGSFLNHDRIFETGNHRRAEQVEWNLLVVNVGGLDYDLPSTEEQLIDDWFRDSASLSTQIAECSANKMTFSPRVGRRINNGVLTLFLERPVSVYVRQGRFVVD